MPKHSRKRSRTKKYGGILTHKSRSVFRNKFFRNCDRDFPNKTKPDTYRRIRCHLDQAKSVGQALRSDPNSIPDEELQLLLNKLKHVSGMVPTSSDYRTRTLAHSTHYVSRGRHIDPVNDGESIEFRNEEAIKPETSKAEDFKKFKLGLRDADTLYKQIEQLNALENELHSKSTARRAKEEAEVAVKWAKEAESYWYPNYAKKAS